MTSRKQPGVAFWATVVVVVALAGYPLSFGPACWISARVQPTGEFVAVVYRPLLVAWIENRFPSWIDGVLGTYARMDTTSISICRTDRRPPTIEIH